ncbi:MAG: type VI secretion protein IcmF/TssM N-terminal domain-containing protein [Smithellaceae bacterium]|jgi:type VI secretion system protein ImpL|nr:hypothetical protein [Syntrophaceae bacterium]OQC55431.1 MAG: hypothetical protein BWX55_00097 [Deltaproteobacteria bacterium ADurb.Bin022]HPL96517.1 type VI secretion protein IcmF/TssM N-terminal domain-containing protein [Smithellaceae bacterium]
MKNTLLKVLKYFLIAALLLVLLLIVIGIAIALQWPWWVTLFVLLFIIGLIVGGVFLRELLTRGRGTKMQNAMLHQDDDEISTLSGKEKAEKKQMQAKWKEAIEVLRKSHLKKMGNPLYVLPWYMVIGESGSGKTTSLNSARLATPFPELAKTAGLSGTRNCEWWFLEQSIVIDTAGRYAIPVNGEPDWKEWRKFLSLLVKYRRKEPLNGLILSVAADKLINNGEDALKEEARTMRRRIDELMSVLGVKFPVYVLVTKCDLIRGINHFCARLPDESLRQPMGMINQNLSTDIGAFLENALDTVGRRLRNMRMLILNQQDPKTVDFPLLFFPEEFDVIRGGLSVYVKALFGSNPYQETPMLRGLFFSSGKQKGNPTSHFEKTLGIRPVGEELPDTSRGLFLHDFFARVLPRDRRLLFPTRRAIEWSSVTNNLGLVSWIILCVALCGLLSFSFVRNLAAISGISEEFQALPVLHGEDTADYKTMEGFRSTLLAVEEQNADWWFPRFGLHKSLHVERELKGKYCMLYQDRFMVPYDQMLIQKARSFDADISDDLYARYMAHLVRRINILRSAPFISDPKRFDKMLLPRYFLPGVSDSLEGQETTDFREPLFVSYLAWREDTERMKKEILELETALKSLYALRGDSFNWLVELMSLHGDVLPVTLASFWNEGATQQTTPTDVPAAYTRAGKSVMDGFIGELTAAYPAAPSVRANRQSFEETYRLAAFQRWRDFMAGFTDGSRLLETQSDWDDMAVAVIHNGGPYMLLMDKVAHELSPLRKDSHDPDWLIEFDRYNAFRKQAVAYKIGLLKTIGQKIGSLTGSSGRKVRQAAEKSDLRLRMSAGTGYRDYRDSLIQIMPAAESKQIAFQMTEQTFKDDPATSRTPFYLAHKALRGLIAGVGEGKDPDPAIVDFISGPFDFLWIYARRLTTAQLEGQWNEQVLAPTAGLSQRQAMPMLVGPDGLVWKFITGSAAPFLNRNDQLGYYPKEVLGGTLLFGQQFYDFLNKGAKASATAQLRQKNYNVGISGLPTRANKDAAVQPHLVRLELQCGGTSQTLVNQNYPVGKTFYWSSESCGDVVLTIEAGDAVLTRRYMGPQAFPDFLREFRGGTRTFGASEFPGEKDALRRLKIRFVQVAFRFVGSAPLLQTVESMPAELPRSIGSL